MTIHESQTPSRSNVETGVPGFDEILGGGLVRGGVYLLEGMAGAGKTILSSQIGFHRVSKGEKVLYMTLIAESHDKLLAHLKGLSFFDETAVAQQMLFVSGYHELMQDGLDGFLKLIASSIYDYRPSLMIIDGFRSAREFSETELSLSKFIHELNALVAAMDCTTLLLAPLSGNEPHPEHTLVDGLIELNRYNDGMRRATRNRSAQDAGAQSSDGQAFLSHRRKRASDVPAPGIAMRRATRPGRSENTARLRSPASRQSARRRFCSRLHDHADRAVRCRQDPALPAISRGRRGARRTLRVSGLLRRAAAADRQSRGRLDRA